MFRNPSSEGPTENDEFQTSDFEKSGSAGSKSGNQESSSSGTWMTEIPTRTSLQFSNITGFSSDPLDSASKPSCISRNQLFSTTEATNEITKLTVWNSEDTCFDHLSVPTLKKAETKKHKKKKNRKDRKWNEKVGKFLKKDPIHPPPQKPTQNFVMKHRYFFLPHGPYIGYHWKQAVRTLSYQVPPLISDPIVIIESDI